MIWNEKLFFEDMPCSLIYSFIHLRLVLLTWSYPSGLTAWDTMTKMK